MTHVAGLTKGQFVKIKPDRQIDAELWQIESVTRDNANITRNGLRMNFFLCHLYQDAECKRRYSAWLRERAAKIGVKK